MKKIKVFYLALLACAIMLAPNKLAADAVSSDQHQAVLDTAHAYFKGVANGDMALMERAFDMEFGHIKYVIKDRETGEETIRSATLADFAKNFKEATKDTWTSKVLSVDIVDGRMAMVKLDFDTPRTHYVDYLVMYKREEGWRIINKTFVANPKAE